MHDELRRLVDHDEGSVLVGDLKGDLLRCGRSWLRLGHDDCVVFTGFDPVCPVFYCCVLCVRYVPRTQECLHRGTAHVGQALGEKLVEALTGFVRRHRKPVWMLASC